MTGICQVIVVGNNKSGKSSLISSYVGSEGVKPYLKTQTLHGNQQVQNKIFEKSNYEYYNYQSLRSAHAIIITVDMTSKGSLNDLRLWLSDVERYAKNNVIIVVAATKTDLTERHQIDKKALEEYIKPLDIPYQFVSSTKGEGVDATFRLVNEKYLYKLGRDFEPDDGKQIMPQASLAEMNKLLKLIESVCVNTAVFKTQLKQKSKEGYVSVDTNALPVALSKIVTACKNSGDDRKSDVLKTIGALAKSEHSSMFQWAHSFFEGRSDELNKFYGVLAQLNGANATQKSVVNTLITHLKTNFVESVQRTTDIHFK